MNRPDLVETTARLSGPKRDSVLMVSTGNGRWRRTAPLQERSTAEVLPEPHEACFLTGLATVSCANSPSPAPDPSTALLQSPVRTGPSSYAGVSAALDRGSAMRQQHQRLILRVAQEEPWPWLRYGPCGDEKDRLALREAGVNQALEIDGKVYMPPGQTTAGTPVAVTRNTMKLRSQLSTLGERTRTRASQPSMACLAARIGCPRSKRTSAASRPTMPLSLSAA